MFLINARPVFQIVSFLIISANAGGLYKTCSQVDFCRYSSPENKFSAEAQTLDSNAATFTLKSNDESADLILKIVILENDTFRIKITEPNSTRYELKNVLDGEPKALDYETTSETDDSFTISVSNNKIVVNKSPFNIEFYKNDVKEVIIDGSRLIIENTDSSQAMTFATIFPQAVSFYGIPERIEKLSLQDTMANGLDPYRLRNMAYSGTQFDPSMTIYGTVPLLYGHGKEATAGVFLHNAAQLWIDLTKNTSSSEAYFMVESGTLDLFVLLGPTPEDVVAQYLTLTGTPHLPQLWTLGYHQSRYTYKNQEDVKEVVANFDNYNFPLDAIWLDIDFSNNMKYFTWNEETFSEPEEMQHNLSKTNRKLITINDPHIKVEEGYFVYDGALKDDYFVRNADGSVFEGPSWPGLSSYIDFLNPAAREFYGDMLSYESFAGSTPTLAGIWNDMNEPSVFNDSMEKTLLNDVLHYEDVFHRDIHNIYGYLQAMSSHGGFLKRDGSTKRPFVLTRSHFSGVQRYAAIWTGDCDASWDYISYVFPMCLNANIMGISFCGADVGGFTGNPTEELLMRWYQAGAWLTFYRAHSSSETDRREPYLFSDDVQKVIREAIQLRYQHLPFWYTLFFEHIRFKTPINRPLFYQYPDDENLFDIDNEFLVGRDVMVRPVFQPEVEFVDIYFPGGENEYWVSIVNGHVYGGVGFVNVSVDINSIPIYYRRGSIIVRKDKIRSSSAEMENDGHSLYVVPNEDRTAHGTVYLDDHISFKYKDNLEYNYLSIDASALEISLTPIDDFANSGGFNFYFDKVIYFEINEVPKLGKPGRCRKIVFTRTAKGNLLSDLKLDLSKPIKLNFGQNYD